MAYELETTLRAISILMDIERCTKISGVSITKTWKPGETDNEPRHIERNKFWLDRSTGEWHETEEKHGLSSGYTKEKGLQYFLNGQVLENYPTEAADPIWFRMLKPRILPIWGRRSETRRIIGAEQIIGDHELVVHTKSKYSPSTEDFYIDTRIGLLTKWVYFSPHHGGAPAETELTSLEVPDEWLEYLQREA